MIPFRYAEASALVPLLHVAPGVTTVFAAGSLSPLLAAEALRWPDTRSVMTDIQTPVNDARVTVNKTPTPGTVDAVLLSPEIDPTPYVNLLNKNGIIVASTYVDAKVNGLRNKLRTLTGSAIPYREFVPETLWLVIGSRTKPQRVRRPPDGARRITERFLPLLFSFGKDEIPLVFGKDSPTG